MSAKKSEPKTKQKKRIDSNSNCHRVSSEQERDHKIRSQKIFFKRNSARKNVQDFRKFFTNTYAEFTKPQFLNKANRFNFVYAIKALGFNLPIHGMYCYRQSSIWPGRKMKLFTFVLFNIFVCTFSQASEKNLNQAPSTCQKMLISETSRLRIQEHGASIYIYLKTSGIRVGTMGVNLDSWGRFSGISTESVFRGQGYATEALLAVCEYAFTTKGTSKIIARVSSANLASLHLYQKLGFEGVEVRGSFELVLTRERFFSLKEWIYRHFGSIDVYVQSHGELSPIYEKDFDQHFLEKVLGGIRPNYPVYQFLPIDLTRPPRVIE